MFNLRSFILLIGLLASTAHASLILPEDTLLINGGFEAPDIRDNSWQYYTTTHGVDVPGWSYDGSGMEIWDSLLGVTAPEGEQHAELNAHGANNHAYSFSQSFLTEAGQTYQYGFSYSARRDNRESFYAGIVGLTDDDLFQDHTKGTWNMFSGSFVATSTTSTIIFTSNDALGDTTGNLIDAVYVVRSVPEPSSIFLLAVGLVGLGFSRRQQAKS